MARAAGSDTRAAASAGPASGPSTYSSPMCDRSNRPARSRTVRCSSMIEPYWTGISQPPNSMSRAPSARWTSASGVRWTGRSGASVTARPRRRRSRRRFGRRRAGPRLAVETLGRPRDEVALGLEGEHRRGGLERDPANLVELVVVTREVAADRVHQEVVDGLVDPGARLDERVLDRIERRVDPDLEPGLLLDLAHRGLLAALARDRRALGQRPGAAVTLAPTAAHDEPRPPGIEANDDAAGRGGGRGPQSRHGADAAPGRRAVPERPDLAHSMATDGRGRPIACRRTCAGWIVRQLARNRARGATSGPCRTVVRRPSARKLPVGRSPRRRSRTRVDGRTN